MKSRTVADGFAVKTEMSQSPPCSDLIHDAAQEDAAQGPETSAVSASSPNAAQEVTNRDEALTLAPK